MIKLTATAIVLSIAGSASYAGGYTAPVIHTVPVVQHLDTASNNWSGHYAGMSYGVQRGKKPVNPYTKTDLHRDLTKSGCSDPSKVYTISYPDFTYRTTCADLIAHSPDAGWDTATVDGGHNSGEASSHDSTLGVFAGYRYQMQSSFVVGIEGAYSKVGSVDSVRIMSQAGYSFGRVLPYLTAGYDFTIDEIAYGVGVDTAITSNLIVGVVYTRSGDTDRIEARLGWRF